MADTEDNEEQTRQVAVVTGASSGIGMATALEFARQGYDVVLAARRRKELEDVAKQCQEHEVETLVVPTDTSDDKAVRSLCEAAVQRFGHIDVWVNDAGVYLTGKFEDTPLEDMHRLFDTNFFGYVHGSQAALAEFRRQEHGVLINVSSVNASAPQPYVAAYSASKAAVRALDESLRMELDVDELQDKIHVCTVMPASIDTNIFQNAGNYTGKEIEALEPVYDPAYVARQIVKLARHPKRQVIVGPAGKLMAMQSAHMPHMYEKRMSRFTQSNILGNRPATMSDGNLFEPIGHNRGMRGGWRERRLRADKLNIGIGAALAGIFAAGVGVALYKRKKEQERHHGLPGLLQGIFS